jgi:hypothetical protein
MGELNTNLPKPLTVDLQTDAISKLKEGKSNEIFDILVNERKEEIAKLYTKCLREAYKDYNKLYDEIKAIKPDMPEVLDNTSNKVIRQAGISRPLKERRDKLIADANKISDLVTLFKAKSYDPLVDKYKSKFNEKKND